MSLLRTMLFVLLCCCASHVRAQDADPVNLSAIFFDPEAPGFGVNVTHQGSVLFVAWYTYGSAGEVLWLTMAASRQEDGRYEGPITRFTGQSFDLIDGQQAFNESAEIGVGEILATEDAGISFRYQIGDIDQTRELQRFAFVEQPPVCSFTTESRAEASNFSDIWWNPSESGWGLTLIHQGDTIFAAWFTYDAQNQPQWIVASDLQRQTDGSFSGALSRPESGTPFDQIDGPATSFPIPSVGSAELVFVDGENLQFEYTLDGVAQTKMLTRFVFVAPGDPVTICADAAQPIASVPPSECDSGVAIGDEFLFRSSNGAEFRRRYSALEEFDGVPAYVLEQIEGGAVVLKFYYQMSADEETLLGAETFNPGGTFVAQRFHYVPPVRFRRAPPIDTSYTLEYVLERSIPGPRTTVATYSETITRLSNDPQSITIGDFDACRFTRNQFEVVGNNENRYERSEWRSPLVGLLRGSQIIRPPVGQPVSSGFELLEATVRGVQYPTPAP